MPARLPLRPVGHVPLLALGLLTACAGAASPTTSSSTAATSGHDVPAAAASMTLLGVQRNVAMLGFTLPAHAAIPLPNDGCQEALVVVRSGSAELTAPGAPPATLGAGAAARLPMGADRPAELRANEGAGGFVVLARPLDHAFAEAESLETVVRAPSGCRRPAGEAAVRIAPSDTTGPFPQGDGALRAYVYLDMPRHGAGLASLGYLDADASVGVPEHGHETAAEVLFFESGAGTMRLGETTLRIEAGRFVFIPPGVRHGLVPDGTSPLRALQVYTPSGPEQRFRPIR